MLPVSSCSNFFYHSFTLLPSNLYSCMFVFFFKSYSNPYSFISASVLALLPVLLKLVLISLPWSKCYHFSISTWSWSSSYSILTQIIIVLLIFLSFHNQVINICMVMNCLYRFGKKKITEMQVPACMQCCPVQIKIQVLHTEIHGHFFFKLLVFSLQF